MIEVTVAWDRTQEKWFVMHNADPVSSHDLKQTAEKEGRRYAKRNRPSKLFIENKKGLVSYQQVYLEEE